MTGPCKFQSPQRRQAHCYVHRAAAGWNLAKCCAGFCLYPPHPPITKAAPAWGKTRQGWGRAIVFCNAGVRGERRKAVDCVACHYAKRGSTKRSGLFASFVIPHFAAFSPHFGFNVPHPPICGCGPAYLSIYLFSEREVRKVGGQREKRAIHSLGFGAQCVSTLFLMYPQFFVDAQSGCKPMLVWFLAFCGGNPHIHSQKCPGGLHGR